MNNNFNKIFENIRAINEEFTKKGKETTKLTPTLAEKKDYKLEYLAEILIEAENIVKNTKNRFWKTIGDGVLIGVVSGFIVFLLTLLFK